jgi:AraC-like DNA-binding protein
MLVVMLTFPRALAPVAGAKIRPLIGTVMPRSMSGRNLIARFLIGLTDTVDLASDPSLADVLYECTVGLIRQRLGQPHGISTDSRRLLHLAYLRDVIRRRLGDPMLDPDRIAAAANFSPRYLHKIFQEAGLTPMQDPTLAKTPIKDLIAAHGYVRSDQFARDFKQLFGVSATQVRRHARQLPPKPMA